MVSPGVSCTRSMMLPSVFQPAIPPLPARSNSPQASFSWAWALDERPEERSRGVTVDVAQARFRTPRFNVTLLDAPGHRCALADMRLTCVRPVACFGPLTNFSRKSFRLHLTWSLEGDLLM